MEVADEVGLALIVVAGVGAQWLAARLRLPAVLVLLVAGILIGPVSGVLDPDTLLGDLLFPTITLGVALLLFDGGLSLRFAELGDAGRVVRLLLTVGVLITALIGTAVASLVLDVSAGVATLIGAILVVSGPTVVGPLLRFARARGRAATALRWEGIFVDPIGATLGIVVLSAVLSSSGRAPLETLFEILVTAAAGSAVGLIVAGLLVLAQRRSWVPEQLEIAIVLGLVLAAFGIGEELRSEAGLFATTVLGVALANQRSLPIRRIAEFKETLAGVIVASLFILLASRLDLDELWEHLGPALIIAAALVLVARPLVVALATFRSRMTWRERAFMAWMAPRGIVAASTSSLFALQLDAAGIAGSEVIVPVVFTVILVTVAVYGLTVTPVAARLGLRARSTGIVVVGAGPWVDALVAELREARVPVLVLAVEAAEAAAARERGLPVASSALHDNLIDEALREELEAADIEAALVLTASEPGSALALSELTHLLGREAVAWVPPAGVELDRGAPIARRAGAPALTREALDAWIGAGGRVHGPDEEASAGAPVVALRPGGAARLVIPGRPPAAGERTIELLGAAEPAKA